MPMAHAYRTVEVDETRGFMKVVVDARTDQILGCAVLGIEVGEAMAMLQIAMMGGTAVTAAAGRYVRSPRYWRSRSIICSRTSRMSGAFISDGPALNGSLRVALGGPSGGTAFVPHIRPSLSPHYRRPGQKKAAEWRRDDAPSSPGDTTSGGLSRSSPHAAS